MAHECTHTYTHNIQSPLNVFLPFLSKKEKKVNAFQKRKTYSTYLRNRVNGGTAWTERHPIKGREYDEEEN